MKDVINSNDFEKRKAMSQSISGEKRFTFILKQALKLLRDEPLISFAIIGSVI